ncbi:MAG: site-specific integrase [Gallionellaceae bacterium]|nr:site-specific integrase [Gallionellaceae bacterium]
MATIKARTNQDGTTSYIVQIRRKGYPPISKSFKKESEARDYAILQEASILKNENPNPREKTKWTIPQVIEWYIENPSQNRKLETKKHFQRLDFLKREFQGFTVLSLTASILQKWINARLLFNSPATVYHYFVALRNAMEHHSLMNDYNQSIFLLAKCPTTSNKREQRFQREDIAKLFRAVNKKAKVKKIEFKLSVLFSIETASRIGEMLKLQWKNVSLEKRTVKFEWHTTKSKAERTIPLSICALKILKWIKKHYPHKANDRVFSFYHLNEHHLSRQFHIACGWAGIEDRRYHDLRHEGVSRLYEKTTLTDMEIASITGHKTLQMLATYANLRHESTQAKIDKMDKARIISMVATADK